MSDGLDIRIDLTQTPDPADIDLIEKGLAAYHDSCAGPLPLVPIAILLRDDSGRTLGGLHGYSYADWLFIEQLWIPEALRRKGWGRRLMAMAEEEAVRRGCHSACLDSFSFGAPAFYRRLGYQIALSLADYPIGHQTLVLTKALLRR
jgi:GNAT superfamily N-acetyltransferase